MIGWESLAEKQPEVVRFLCNSYQKNRLVHAYILEGPQGAGKMEVAKNVAKMLLCESGEGVCHQCRQCQLVESEGHVNLHIVRPDGINIKKEQIQSLQAEFSKMGAENSAKIYIIDEADKMSSSAANSLLKFLEEPMPNTYAILLTRNKQKLLPTIRSRSVILTFKALSYNDLVQKYEEAGLSQNASIIATLSQNIEEGLEIAASPIFSKLIDLVIKTEECFIKTKMDPSILLVSEGDVTKEKEHQFLYLKLMMLYYEDVLKLKINKEDEIRYKNHLNVLKQSDAHYSLTQCLSIISALLETEKRLNANGNVLLCFDQLFLQMKGGY